MSSSAPRESIVNVLILTDPKFVEISCANKLANNTMQSSIARVLRQPFQWIDLIFLPIYLSPYNVFTFQRNVNTL